MNPKIKFEGSINGRTYSDEKVFQYALRDAIAKGEDIEVHATSTMADAQEEITIPKKPMYENFEIAINPDKIAANLECAQDRDEFIANLGTGLQAVVGQFTDAMKENSIDPAMACKKFDEEINSVISKYNKLLEKSGQVEKKIDDLERKIEAAEEELETVNSTMVAFNLLYKAYVHMRDLCTENEPVAEKKECGCDKRNCKPATMNELIEQFVNLWK
jgi:hypothetical protein